MMPISPVCSATSVVIVFEISTSAESSASSVMTLEEVGELLGFRLAGPVARCAQLRQVGEAAEAGNGRQEAAHRRDRRPRRRGAVVAQPEREPAVAALAR